VRLPPRLERGDLVGIVSPSSAVAAGVPRRFERGVAELERRGFRVRVGEHARLQTGWTAGTASERAADLHAMFGDPEVRAIVCTIGGYNANQLLELLDYELIAANPTIFVGFSDITALHGAIHARTGLATMLGPALLPQFGELGGVDEYTWQAFERVRDARRAGGRLPAARALVSRAALVGPGGRSAAHGGARTAVACSASRERGGPDRRRQRQHAALAPRHTVVAVARRRDPVSRGR